MSEPTFTPAAGRFAPTRLYDPVVALTRERLWRALTAMYVAPRAGDLIADVGCGTGSFAVVDWRLSMGDALAEPLGERSVDTVVSSLVLHQCPLPMKRAVLASMYSVLRPGGKVVIADFGRQRTTLMRLGFRIVQFADGKQDTQPNADGVLPELLSESGFHDVREAEVVPTVSGSISIYVARKE